MTIDLVVLHAEKHMRTLPYKGHGQNQAPSLDEHMEIFSARLQHSPLNQWKQRSNDDHLLPCQTPVNDKPRDSFPART